MSSFPMHAERSLHMQSVTRRSLQRFLQGDVSAAEGVAPEILASWLRSSRAGLLPGDSVLAASALTRHDAKRAAEQHRLLIDAVRGPAEALFKQLPSTLPWIVVCLSADGTIVHGVGCRLTAPKILLAGLQVGRPLQESHYGTTAPACALADRGPGIVVGDQHYLQELTSLACAAVPFFGPNGEIAGVIDASCVGAAPDAGVLELLTQAARSIENETMRKLPGHTLLSLNRDPRLVGTAYEGLIALDDESQRCLLNVSARRLLGLDPAAASPLPPEALFDAAEWKRILLPPGGPTQPRAVRDTRGFLHYAHREQATGRLTAIGPLDGPARRSQLGDGLPLDQDPKVADVLQTSIRAVRSNVPLILEGESGTGKEVMAQAIHRGSSRADKPFVAINCAAIPEGLIEAELFGYVDGAFTGGRRGGSPGKIAQADGGTLFLDEIGDMPLALQTRLLRVLQERQVIPVGGLQPIPVEFALICATHCDLSLAVKQQRFRSDLFYRIDGLLLRLPPLRERRDMRSLAQRFLLECGEGEGAVELDEEVFGLFASYPWPGNIRQLRNVIRAAAVLAGDRPTIGVDDLPEALKRELNLCSDATNTCKPLELAELETIRRVVDVAQGNMTLAARQLGISRSTLYKRLRVREPRDQDASARLS